MRINKDKGRESLDNSMHSIDVHVGKTLRRLRRQMGYRQKDIADVIGVSFQQIQKYEKGDNRFNFSQLCMLAQFFNVKVSSFLPDPDEKDVINSALDQINLINTQLDNVRVSVNKMVGRKVC